MRYRVAKIAVVVAVALSSSPLSVIAQQKQNQPKQQKKAPDRNTSQASLTGCIDEQDGQYVLIRDQTRELIATLEADGFPAEGFAKHLGHKVTVRGTANPAGSGRPIFKVRAVEAVSDSCGSQEP